MVHHQNLHTPPAVLPQGDLRPLPTVTVRCGQEDDQTFQGPRDTGSEVMLISSKYHCGSPGRAGPMEVRWPVSAQSVSQWVQQVLEFTL